MTPVEARKAYGRARYWADPKRFTDAALARIDISDVVWNTHCPVFGVPLQSSQTNGKGDSDLSLSLDRIDSSKGYVKGNVRTISNRANKLKNNMTITECELILKTWYSM